MRNATGPRFSGHPKTEWLDDGRDMQLLTDFSFIDSKQNRWTAPSNSTIDGTSIPPVFWSIVGGPYEGKYRNASVVHDVECQLKREPWQTVHKMFYEACRAGGVRRLKALLMYAAVYLFGPRWTSPGGAPLQSTHCTMTDAIRLTAWVRQQKGLRIASIETLTPAQLKQQVSRTALDAERKRITARHLQSPDRRYPLDPVLDE
jgi:hypothetical protein